MNKRGIRTEYGKTFESIRRLNPRIWDSNYCLLRGLTNVVKGFSYKYVTPNMKIIDFGCGAKPYRSLFPESVKYIGVDSCPSPYVDVVILPGQPVPLANASADCIISTQVVYLISDYKPYLRECRRLLRDDGRLLITSHGTWTFHPASGGDYYRFTQDGMRHILNEAGFEIEQLFPIVGTLGTGLHLRQLIFNAWLRKIPLGGKAFASLLNIFTNSRIILEDRFCPLGTRMSSPVIFAAIAHATASQHE